MRITEVILTEKTVQNMQVLSDCVDLIIHNMPSVFPAGTSDGREGYRLSGLDALIRKYDGTPYADAVKSFRTLTIMFRNTQVSNTVGSYTGKPQHVLNLNIAALMETTDTKTREQVLAYRGDKSIKTFRGIVLHEIRHIFQSYLYSTYYYGRGDDENYRKSLVELDAAWMHHLQDYNVSDYPTVAEYTKAVMLSFAAYKDLDPKTKAHYIKKTASYYFDKSNGGAADGLALPAPERLKLKRAKLRSEILRALSQFTSDIDLRSLEGYDPEARRFFFPVSAINGVRGIIDKDKTVSPANSPIIFLVLSLALPPDMAPEVTKYLQAVQKTSLQIALENVPTTFVSDNGVGFDTTAIERQIVKIFH